MKRFMAVLICAVMFAGMLSVSAFAVTSTVTDDTWTSLDIKALISQNISSGEMYSDLAEDYYNDEWYIKELPEDYGLEEQILCTVEMRGFAISPDGKYAFAGNLNGGTGFRGAAMINLYSGKITDVYYLYDGDEDYCNYSVGPFSYPKGIAVDDRGYVYVGFAFSANYNGVNLGIAKADYDNETLSQISLTRLCDFGDIGDPNGIKVGVNGVDVKKIGDKYYCFAVLNYDYDALCCYDVTDPEHPVVNKNFGKDGYIEFSNDSCTVVPEGGIVVSDAYYLDIDTDGTVLLCSKFSDGTYGVIEINPEGTQVLKTIPLDSAYTVCIYGSYTIIGTKEADKGLYILDSVSLDLIKQVAMPEEYPASIPYVTVVNDILYIDHQSQDGGFDNAILVAPLTENASLMLDYQTSVLNDPNHSTGDDTTDTSANDTGDVTGDITTGDITTTGDTLVDITTADVTETTTPTTDAVTTNEPVSTTPGTTAAPADATAPGTSGDTTDSGNSGSGCGGIIASGAAIFALITAVTGAVMVKRGKND